MTPSNCCRFADTGDTRSKEESKIYKPVAEADQDNWHTLDFEKETIPYTIYSSTSKTNCDIIIIRSNQYYGALSYRPTTSSVVECYH